MPWSRLRAGAPLASTPRPVARADTEILKKKIQRLVKESQDEEAKIEKEHDYERDGSDHYEEQISKLDEILETNIKIARLENPITELGNYFYHIKLT